MKKGIFPLLFLLFFSTVIFSQHYPYWFIYPGKVGCDEYEVGYSTTGYYEDSSKVVAFKNGCVNHARNAYLKIEGGQGFWETENGTYWMGEKISESFDTASIQIYKEKLKLVSTFSNDEITLALLCSSDFELLPHQNQILDLNDLKTPNWLDKLPSSTGYMYAIAMTPKYYYETSSWLEAERQARINLARQISVKIKSEQKVNISEGQEIRDEEFSVVLRNVSVVERWIDTKRNIFYVLIKMPI